MNSIGAPEFVIILMIMGFLVLPLMILVMVFRNTRKPPIPPPGQDQPPSQGPPPSTFM